MSVDSSGSKICPTCGTHLSESATRCLVCGRTFTDTEKSKKKVQGPHMPEIVLSLPIALSLMAIILVVGAGIVFMLLRNTDAPAIADIPDTATPTLTATTTLTPTASPTASPMPTFTPLPPVEYTVKEGDYCSTIAAIFNVSINSIVLLNNLPADCGMLSVGQTLQIPQPTPTASPYPTATLSGAEATTAACETISYTVGENDTLSGIAATYNVSMEAIKEYNGLSTDMVYEGQPLTIPLCRRNPTPGPTPTATLPPPYAAPNLLQPMDGEIFLAANETITLQWAAVSTMQDNEAYAVTIEDISEESGLKVTEYVTDTKYIIPTSLRPTSDTPHIFRWSVMPVRQSGTTTDGQPIWNSAGARSISRVFGWWGTNIASPTP
jgi:LysM repeat protein